MKCRDKCLSIVSSYDEQKAIEGEELIKNGRLYFTIFLGFRYVEFNHRTFQVLNPTRNKNSALPKKKKLSKNWTKKPSKLNLNVVSIPKMQKPNANADENFWVDYHQSVLSVMFLSRVRPVHCRK